MNLTARTTSVQSTTQSDDTLDNQIERIKNTDVEESVRDIRDTINSLLEALRDITLSRHILDYGRELINAYSFVSIRALLTVGALDITSRALKGVSGGVDMFFGITRILDNDFGTTYSFRGILETIRGAGKIASSFRVPGADIVHGSAAFTYAITRITQDENGHNAVNYSRMFAGAFRALSGVFREIPHLRYLAIPLDLYAGMFSLAGRLFEIHWILGFLALALGNALNIALLIPIKSFLTISLTAFGVKSAAVSAKLAVTIVGAVAGLASLAVVARLIADTLRSEPPMPAPARFAIGGFPEPGLPFIARESGAELVGILQATQGWRTAVINNDQIVEGVSRGVYNAVSVALRDSNSKSRYTARVFLNGKQIAMANAV